MKSTRPPLPQTVTAPAFRWGWIAGPAALLALLFLIFPQARHPFSLIQVTGDSLSYFYPIYHLTRDNLLHGRFTLVTDLAYHGAPLAALFPGGLLSPLVLVISGLFPGLLAYNLLYLLPFLIGPFGALALGRRMGWVWSACVFLAILWFYNGTSLGRVDGLNMQWANALLPWTLLAILKSWEPEGVPWALAAALPLGLAVWVGHPQFALFQAVFLVIWCLGFPHPAPLGTRLGRGSWTGLGALVFSAPAWVHTLEVILVDGPMPHWGDLDRFYHSWTPLNPITLVFPWFFGKDQLDGHGVDYWWQYHFGEMQVDFALVGLLFILIFLAKPNPHRRWVGSTAAFGIAMALGKFSPLYRLLSGWAPFAWFRDPARWWFPASWALAFGAAWAWNEWRRNPGAVKTTGRRILAGLALGMTLGVGVGNLLLRHGRVYLDSAAGFLIRKFLLGDALHQHPAAYYLGRLPEKWAAVSLNLDPAQPRVFIPFLALGLLVGFWEFAHQPQRAKWAALGLLLVATGELAYFRFPYGESFGNPAQLAAARTTPPRQRLWTVLSEPSVPSPDKTSEMSLPDYGWAQNRANLAGYFQPELPRYHEFLSRLGWWGWVDKSLDPLGFRRHLGLLRALGVDEIESDRPLSLPPSFHPIRREFPFAWRLSPTAPQAALFGRVEVALWPELLDRMDRRGFDPLHTALVEEPIHPVPLPGRNPDPDIKSWQPTRLQIATQNQAPALLVVQKTFLAGWKARVNGQSVQAVRAQGVLLGVPLPPGPCEVELEYLPTGLRLAFFLSWVFLGLLAGVWIGRR